MSDPRLVLFNVMQEVGLYGRKRQAVEDAAIQLAKWREVEAVATYRRDLAKPCPECNDPMGAHLTDIHPSYNVEGRWCYCERKP